MDVTDARLLLALIDDPRGTVLSLAYKIGLSRNTVHADSRASTRRNCWPGSSAELTLARWGIR